jgi:PIN domain nuclease of toxin-antitoxin system
VRLLLDTHALLWWLTDDPKLPDRCADWIEDPANAVAVSPISAYELRFKATKGLLPGGEVVAADIGTMAEQANIAIVQLTMEHALRAGALPLPHRDPFDRLLAAQALVDGYSILSIDAVFDAFGVERIW